MIAELAANLKASGSNLAEHLENLERSYGKISAGQVSVRFSDLSLIGKIMAGVRSNPPKEYDGLELKFTDLKESKELRTDAVILQNATAKLIFRPSGTEPKLKCYLQYRGKEEGLAKLKAFASELIASYQ
jgi:phosphomannomutase